MLSRSDAPISVLRGHEAEVHALCHVRLYPRGPKVLVSGSADGTVIVWDPLVHQQGSANSSGNSGMLVRWTAHTGGVLELATEGAAGAARDDEGEEDDEQTAGVFWSQGRDGCIHQWSWQGMPGISAPAARDSADDVLAFLADLLPPSSSSTSSSSLAATPASAALATVASTSTVRIPRRIRTLKVGYGNFCRMSVLLGSAQATGAKARTGAGTGAGTAGAAPSVLLSRSSLHEEDDAEAAMASAPKSVWLLAPAIDSGKLLLYSCSLEAGAQEEEAVQGKRGSRLVSAIAVPREAARAAARALGRKLQGAEEGEEGASMLNQLMNQTGMATHCKLVALPSALQLQLQRRAAPSASAASASAADSPSSRDLSRAADSVVAAAAYQNADGTPRHPDADSLAELLRRAPSTAAKQKAAAAQAAAATQATQQDPLPLVAASFENGCLYILDVLPQSAVSTSGGNEVSVDADADAASGVRVALLLPVCREPLMTFALSPLKQETGSDRSASCTAVLGSSGSSLFVARLSLHREDDRDGSSSPLHGHGQLLRRIALASPGVSVSLAVSLARNNGDVALVGGWDGSLHIIPLSGWTVSSETAESEEGKGQGQGQGKGKEEEARSLVPLSIASARGTCDRVPAVLRHSDGVGVYAIAALEAEAHGFDGFAASSAVSSPPVLHVASGLKSGRIALWRTILQPLMHLQDR
jgi:hypothetical protein